MTALDTNALYQWFDAFGMMGLSAIIWLCYDLLTTIFSLKNKIASAVFHIVFFAFAGLFVFCFVVGKTTLGVIRWYLAFGFILGAIAYYGCFSKLVRMGIGAIKRLLCLIAYPFALLWQKTGKRAYLWLRARLQKRRELVYNRRIQKKQERQKKRGAQNDVEPNRGTAKKEPRKAYTQT